MDDVATRESSGGKIARVGEGRKTDNQPWPQTHFDGQTYVLVRCENAVKKEKKLYLIPIKVNIWN